MTVAILSVFLKLPSDRLSKRRVDPLHGLLLGNGLRHILYKMIPHDGRLPFSCPKILPGQKTANLPDKSGVVYHIAVGEHILRCQRLKLAGKAVVP